MKSLDRAIIVSDNRNVYNFYFLGSGSVSVSVSGSGSGFRIPAFPYAHCASQFLTCARTICL